MEDAYLSGQLAACRKDDLERLLKDAGFGIVVGAYAIRFSDFDHFVLRELGGDVGLPIVTADSLSRQALRSFAGRVSEVLAKGGVRHWFAIYDTDDVQTDYLHHDWPENG